MSNFSCDSFEQIEKNLEKLFVPKYYPGFILSIYENGNETYYIKKGYDDIFKKTEYKRNSIFRIYSMTKPIVSTAAMQLIEKKQLDLDDDVSKSYIDKITCRGMCWNEGVKNTWYSPRVRK